MMNSQQEQFPSKRPYAPPRVATFISAQPAALLICTGAVNCGTVDISLAGCCQEAEFLCTPDNCI